MAVPAPRGMDGGAVIARLHAAVNARRPANGFIVGRMIALGWTGQPDYRAAVAS